MDKFKALEPTRLYTHSTSTSSRPSAPKAAQVGRLPSDLHLLLLTYLLIPDIPAYARCSHATAALAMVDSAWEQRWKCLGIEKYAMGDVLDGLEDRAKGIVGRVRANEPPTIVVDDEFGEFESVDVLDAHNEEMADFVGASSFDGAARAATAFEPLKSPKSPYGGSLSKQTHRSFFIRAHTLLKPLIRDLALAPHLILSKLASSALPPAAKHAISNSNNSQRTPSLRHQAKTLHLLSLFLSPAIQPVYNHRILHSSLRAAIDRFDATLLAAFDVADGKADEAAMREAAECSWEVWEGASRVSDWEMGKVWAEKREIFYMQGNWDPLDNITSRNSLSFDPMHEFMSAISQQLLEHGSRAVRVFPPEAMVLIGFAERVASEVVGEYIIPLLTRAREVSTNVFLIATAASFGEASRMTDAIIQAARAREALSTEDENEVGIIPQKVGEKTEGQEVITRTQAEDVVYRMFETNMDEYLDEEVESIKMVLEDICKQWSKRTSQPTKSGNTQAPPQFLTSHNPAQVKRTVLASFTDVLLMPVTIVPRTVGAAFGSIKGAGVRGGEAAVQGISMLNPARWGGSGPTGQGAVVYSKQLGGDGATLFEADEVEEETVKGSSVLSRSTLQVTPASTAPTSRATTPISETNKLELLLSLDVALELIHATREALKRVETFSGFPGHYGHRVRDTIEEVFILLLQVMSDQHISPGFSTATEQMTEYKPADHEQTTSVAPLLQFFELVHIGDMIQSMVQVYFDKELAPHIDRTDFLNAVVREKKRFENVLDDSVAGGLNAGTELLMNQVEHIIVKLTQPREYYPPEDQILDLGPTKGCTEAIKCLEMHCKLLKGSTSKEVLEVFYQEVGIRLIAILQKHIKRQIISLSGGFQVIADLNTYGNFITSLKVPAIASDFSHLKMLGHVYVVEDARDLAQIVRDVTRYGGAYRPEDIYEFIQRRSDWKKIEKIVDKTMYNLSFKEDCVVC